MFITSSNNSNNLFESFKIANNVSKQFKQIKQKSNTCEHFNTNKGVKKYKQKQTRLIRSLLENVCVFHYILNLIDNVEYVVYALYSSIVRTKFLFKYNTTKFQLINTHFKNIEEKKPIPKPRLG
jgi:hypothetical protein